MNIIKAAEKEGLAKKGEKLGYTMNPVTFPALAGYSAHPALFDFLNNLSRPLSFNAYDKITRFAKGIIVFDPAYFVGTALPFFRTLVTNMDKSPKLPKYFKDAWKEFVNAEPAYLEFVENGGASSPFLETKDFQHMIDSAKLPKEGLLSGIANRVLSVEGLKRATDAASNFTWTLERIAKFAHYKMLKEKGFSPRDAAQLAAENYGDYAKLPPKSRRWLSRIFFAPSFQILNLFNDASLLKAPYDLAKDIIKDPKNFKQPSIAKERVGSLIGTGIILLAMDKLFENYGFKREEFGTRYYSDFEDENGKQKELVLSPAHSLNVGLRWINTGMRGFEPAERSPLQHLTGRVINMLGPVPAFAKEIYENRSRDFKKIWDPVRDGPVEVAQKITLHAIKKLEPFMLEKVYTPKEKEAKREKLDKEFGWLYYAIDSLLFTYDRKPIDEKRQAKIKSLTRQMEKLAKNDQLTDKEAKRFQDAIEHLKEKGE